MACIVHPLIGMDDSKPLTDDESIKSLIADCELIVQKLNFNSTQQDHSARSLFWSLEELKACLYGKQFDHPQTAQKILDFTNLLSLCCVNLSARSWLRRTAISVTQILLSLWAEIQLESIGAETAPQTS